MAIRRVIAIDENKLSYIDAKRPYRSINILKGIRLRDFKFALAPLKLFKILTAAHQAANKRANIFVKHLLYM